MKEIYINRILVSDKVCFGNKGFKNFIAYKDVKIRSLYTFLPKGVHREENLMKLNICLFW